MKSTSTRALPGTSLAKLAVESAVENTRRDIIWEMHNRYLQLHELRRIFVTGKADKLYQEQADRYAHAALEIRLLAERIDGDLAREVWRSL